MPLAFEWVALTVFLAEANFCADRLQLPDALPITRTSLTHVYIAPRYVQRLGGRIDTEKYMFSFLNEGRLRYIVRLDPFDGQSTLQAFPSMVHTKSRIDKAAAYGLARKWLEFREHN